MCVWRNCKDLLWCKPTSAICYSVPCSILTLYALSVLQYENGEPCTVCGHVMTTTERRQQESVLPTAIIPGSLYLGSYDTASRSEILKAMGITHILNVSGKKLPWNWGLQCCAVARQGSAIRFQGSASICFGQTLSQPLYSGVSGGLSWACPLCSAPLLRKVPILLA